MAGVKLVPGAARHSSSIADMRIPKMNLAENDKETSIMPRPLSKIAPDWWEYITLDPEILADAATLSVRDLEKLSRPGSVLYHTLQEFYLAEALEYINASRQSTADNPARIWGRLAQRSSCRWWPGW